MDVQRGFRDKLEKYINISTDFDVDMSIDGSAVYDYSCFGVDGNEKLSDERYMVFYNQPQSPMKELSYREIQGGARFTVSLNKLPASINKLVFTVSIDGAGTMQDIRKHTIKIRQGNTNAIELSLSGSDFQAERAVISIEIYRKDAWRTAAVARGFNGGLSDLLRLYGGQEAPAEKPIEKPKETPKDTPIKQPAAAEKQAPPSEIPSKISLKKGQKLSLQKNNGAPVIIENGWTAKNKDYDLKALIRYRNGKLLYIGAANGDEFLRSPEGAVRHSGDIKHPGELEHIEIVWHPDIASIAVSSYSAIENGFGSFCEYGVFVRIKNGSQTVEIAAADTSVDRNSYTLCFGEIIFGLSPNTFDVSALEMYSKPNSERRIGYAGDRVQMDIGPLGRTKS